MDKDKWKEMVKQYGEKESIAEVARQLRLIADIIENGKTENVNPVEIYCIENMLPYGSNDLIKDKNDIDFIWNFSFTLTTYWPA